MSWVAPAASDAEIDALAALFARGPVAVLTGAGISTESGIPDYRGPETRRRARNPVQYLDFMRSDWSRRRYWARSMLGWPRLCRAQPNAGHRAVTRLEQLGRITGIVTQNIDSLHGAAGARDLLELHGALARAVCLSCRSVLPRDQLQAELERKNPEFCSRDVEQAPDGDAELRDEEIARFRLVECPCGGPLKPDVVFFGENVPSSRVAHAMSWVRAGAALLVVGSSLAIYSGLRFVHAAAKQGAPIALLTLGPTRADPLATLRIDAGAGSTLTRLVERLEG